MSSTYCFGDNISSISVDDPGPDFQINWYDDSNTFLSNNNPFTPSAPGTYFATIEEIVSGCESTAVQATVSENPEITITPGDVDCADDLLTYNLDVVILGGTGTCLLYTSPSPRDATLSRMPSSA